MDETSNEEKKNNDFGYNKKKAKQTKEEKRKMCNASKNMKKMNTMIPKKIFNRHIYGYTFIEQNRY